MPISLKTISRQLPAEDKKTLEVKYKSKHISKYGETELFLHVMGLLLKIHVITGWRIPESDALLTVLQDQLFKKLQENYGNCNIDEIEFAFRNYGTSMKDWGKDVNLAFIDTVMTSYLSHRRQLSDMEESLFKESKIKRSEDEILNAKREAVEVRYQAFLNGNSAFNIQPPDGIATLALDGFCDFDIHEDFIERAFEIIKSKLQSEYESAALSSKHALVEKLKAEMELLAKDDERIIMLSKKIALVYCFYKFKEQGCKNIYTQE